MRKSNMKNLSAEAYVQSQIRLEAARKGIYLWRNNCGAGTLDNGSFIRWGLANESEAVNKVIKSADLIGIRRLVITPEMVGQTVGIFVSREAKAADWHYTGTDREVAQLKWLTLINSYGGDAKFVTGPGSFG